MGISRPEEAHRQAADMVENTNLGIYIFRMEDPQDDRSLRLGLSIVYNIISQHKGTIKVLSEPGKGTEFLITLPDKQSTNQS